MRAALLLTLVAVSPLAAQTPKPRTPAPRSGKIAWYGTWKEGVAAAKRSNHSILLVAAAPHCRSISGMW